MTFAWIHTFSGSISYSAILTPIKFPLVWLLSTWRPHRKSADILAHFLPTSEASALFLFCDLLYLCIRLQAIPLFSFVLLFPGLRLNARENGKKGQRREEK